MWLNVINKNETKNRTNSIKTLTTTIALESTLAATTEAIGTTATTITISLTLSGYPYLSFNTMSNCRRVAKPSFK